MKLNSFLDELFLLHYEDDPDGDDPDGDDPPDDSKNPPAKPPKGRVFTQKEIDDIVEKRTRKARNAQKTALEQFESLQNSLNMTEEQREALEVEIETLRRQTMTQEEIAKREKQRADKQYKDALEDAKKEAEQWRTRHNSLKVGYEIKSAASSVGVIPEQIPFIEAYFNQTAKVVDQKDETGVPNGAVVMVQFTDQDADGKPLPVEVSPLDALKRMKELPENFGHLFAAPVNGGLGGNSGKAPNGAKTGFRKDMSMDEYLKARKENPNSLYGQS